MAHKTRTTKVAGPLATNDNRYLPSYGGTHPDSPARAPPSIPQRHSSPPPTTTPPRAQHPPHAPVSHPGGPSVASFYFHLRFVDCLVSTSRYIGTSHTQLPPLTRHNARRARAHYSNQVYDHVLTTYLTQPVYPEIVCTQQGHRVCGLVTSVRPAVWCVA